MASSRSSRELSSQAAHVRAEERGCWHRFAQQRLTAWQPSFSVPVVLTGFLVAGGLFVVIGVVLLLVSQSVVEYEHDYTAEAVEKGEVGHFDIEVKRDMEPPIWIYYQLDGFHQNHRKYVKSRDDAQMREHESPKFTEAELKAGCSPWVTTNGRVNYPCGLVARSIFNDTFAVVHRSQPSEGWSRLSVNNSGKAIAWPSDTEGKFRNLDPEGTAADGGREHQVALNMWILTQFPPVTCEQQVFSDEKPYAPVEVATRKVTRYEKEVEVADCKNYMGDPQCNFTQNGRRFVCQGDYEPKHQDEWGIESGHFLVWMRIAGLPRFRKLWGKVDQRLAKGTTLRVYFQHNFEVLQFSGRKAFVISTSTPLGGRNDFLGYGYMLVGGYCLLFGLGFAWHHLRRGRQLGDVSLLYPPQ